MINPVGKYLFLTNACICFFSGKTYARYVLFAMMLSVLFSAAAKADDYATLSGNIKNLDGKPLVVYLEPVSKNGVTIRTKSVHSSVVSNDNNFEPAFQVIQKGSVLEIKNNDTVFHNTHISENRITLFNVATPSRDKTVKKIMPRTGFFNIACDLHPWMNATLAVITGPYYSVRWKPGHFQINNIVPGKYYLHTQQPEKDEIITLVNLKANSNEHISF